MKKVKKKEILKTVTNSLTVALKKFKISAPSKKTQKILAKATKDIARQLKGELKNIAKKSPRVVVKRKSVPAGRQGKKINITSKA